MSRGSILCPVKGKSLILVHDWNIPTIINSYDLPTYKGNSGEIVRRIEIIRFGNDVPKTDIDTELFDKIIKSEFGSIIHKWCSKYLEYADRYKGCSVDTFKPKSFKDVSDEFKENVNISYNFAKSKLEYKEGARISKPDMTVYFRHYVKRKFDLTRTQEKMSPTDIALADERFEFKREKICKHCRNRHLKGCCKKYNSNDRTNTEYFLNVELIS